MKTEGLLVGRLQSPPLSIWTGLNALFNRRLPSAEACRVFTRAIRRKPRSNLVRLPNAVHTAVFAPTGVGKGVSIVLPHLLNCPDSCVVVDFKGENYKITAEHRRRAFRNKIVVLDPFKVVTTTPDTFNPLDCITADNPLAIDDCRDLAEALVTRTGQEKEPHWADSAELWIAAMVAVVAQFGEEDDRSLQTVRKLLTNPEKMQAAIKLMCESTDVWDGMLSRLGQQLTQYKDKELGSVLTTTNRFLRFLDTLAIAASTKASTFDPADLRKGRMTVYLVLPPEHMRAQSALLRMWIGSMLRAIVRGGLQEQHKVHFILDEAASLGQMDALDDAVDKFRAYGVRLLFLYQSIGQLKKCWPEGREVTLLSNTTQIYFGVNDLETAKMVSERLGQSTIVVRSHGANAGQSSQSSDDGHASSGRSTGTNENWAQQGRELLRPDEVMGLSERIAIIFTPGVPPIWTTLLRYYEETFVPPGRWQRLWGGVKMFTGSILILAVAVMLALGASVVANEKAHARQVRIQSFYR